MPIIKTKSLNHEALLKQQQKTFEDTISKTPKHTLAIVLYIQSISPLSTISFQQKEWIAQVNAARKPNDTTLFHPTEKLPEEGVCGGLVETWYAYLMQGRYLIDELKSDQPANLDLLRNIRMIQKGRSKSTFLLPLSEANDNSKSSHKENNDLNKKKSDFDLNLSVMSAIEFDEGHQTLLANPDNLKKHLEQLHANSHSEYGLHQIDVCNTQTEKAHTFAWTRIADGYLLFDPNVGEHYFKDYKNLMDYICYNHLSNLYDSRKQSLCVRDYYHADEIKELQFIQTSLRKNLKSDAEAREPHKINKAP